MKDLRRVPRHFPALPAALCAVLALGGPAGAAARKESTLEKAGVGVAVALPVLAGAVTLYHDDWNGMVQLGTETVLTVGTAWALKQFVREKRPDGSDFHSFPSSTTALAASGSSYLWGRYGWEWGLPAFAASQFVSYTRVQADRHHWYDTLASSALAIGYSTLVTSRYRSSRFNTSFDAGADGGSVRFSYAF